MRESIAPIRRAGSGTNELDLRERSCHSAVQPRAQKSLGGLSFHSRLRTRIYETGLRLARSAARCFLSTWGILLVPVATARWTTTSKDASWWVRCRLYYLPTVHFRHGTRAGGGGSQL